MITKQNKTKPRKATQNNTKHIKINTQQINANTQTTKSSKQTKQNKTKAFEKAAEQQTNMNKQF